MLDKEVKRVAENNGAISLYRQAVGLLEQAQVIHLLRCLGRPVRNSEKGTDYMAQEGAHAAGWQDCLDMLMNLEELLLGRFKPGTALPEATYGALSELLNRGDINDEEFLYQKGEISRDEYQRRIAAKSKPSAGAHSAGGSNTSSSPTTSTPGSTR